MVFRIQAALRFASPVQRNAGRTTIANAISGRNSVIIRNADMTWPDGIIGLVWEAEESDTGDAGIIYALIAAMSSPLTRSHANHHTCWHDEGPFPEGDPRNLCIPTAAKVW